MDSNYSGLGHALLSFLFRPFGALLGLRPSSDPSPLGQGAERICKHDVFLSFRGTDTRLNFVDHLYNHLIRKGIFVFKDDKKLPKGKPIESELLQAIQDSRISIVVFSEDYAASTWCLKEMAAIAECKKAGQTVFSVFYDVDPSDVRNQNGVYENAFVLHSKKFKYVPGKVDQWKRAMSRLANSAGWDVRDKPEFGEIEKIVQAVIERLGHKFSGSVDDLIGIQPRVEELENRLKLSSKDDDIRVLGIWGMGGIGKTTHATVLYDRISCQFDACCFIENVSKIYRDGGATAVHKQILRQTLKGIHLETYSPPEISGIVIKLHNVKVLVVLDNVDQLEQLQELAINPKLLCAGSRMIITTRDEHILSVYGVNEVYEVPLLNNNEAWQLFCKKAFKSDDPSSSYVKLTDEVLKYAQRLPLAIRVMGSSLCTRDAIQWRDALDRLGNSPDNKIMDVLQISFEGLLPEEKEIFLHIACFFKGKKEDYVKRILDGCGLHPHIGIPVIIEKSLITIRNQEIHMHEMLQELGKKIVREQFPKHPGFWSRLWLYEDFDYVMMTESGSNNIEAIVLDQKVDVPKWSQLRAEGLSVMMGLRLLILYQRNISGRLDFLSNSLRYLVWHSYPFASLPLNFEPYNLVELNLPNSSIQRLWEGRKFLACLKRLDLSNSKYLIETPNFERIPRLERLDLTGCSSLLQVHPSIGLLDKLAFLSFEGCSSLVSLDLGSESNLSSLTVLHLSGCTKLEITPDFTGLSNLEYLDIEQCTSLSMVDKSIVTLAKLKFLSLRNCTNLVSMPDSINTMTSLMTLDLCGCLHLMNLPLMRLKGKMSSYCLESLICLDVSYCNLREVPDAIGELRCLERLNLEGNNFVSLPFTIQSLSSLAYLNLAHCSELQSLPGFPYYGTSGGSYFKTASGSRNHRSGLYIFDCPMLHRSRSEHWAVSWLIRLVQKPFHFRCGFDIVVPGRIIPHLFNHQFMGGSIIRIVDSVVDDNWTGFAFCVAFEVNNHNLLSRRLPHPFYLSFESEYAEEIFEMPLRLGLDMVDYSEHLWIIYISRPHCHFVKTGAHITFKACPGLEMKRWGLHMVFTQYMKDLNRNILSFDPVRESSSSSGPKIQRPYNWFVTEVVHESSSNISRSKLQLPYNWLVTEEEGNENMQATTKENNLLFPVSYEIVEPMMKLYTEAIDGSGIEKKESDLVWQYRDADLGFGSSRQRKYIDTLISKGHGFESVDQSKVDTLISFGFQDIARKALKASGGDIEKATDWIFSNPDALVSSMDATASNTKSVPNDADLPDGGGRY